MSAIKEQSVDDVELDHQPEEPVGPWPDNLVRHGQHIVEQAHLGDDVHHGIGMGDGCDGIQHSECDEPHDHHAEKFEPVIFDEPQQRKTSLYLTDAGVICCPLIFHRQSVGRQKQENRYAVMSEERKHVKEEQIVPRSLQRTPEPVGIVLKILVFVLFYHRSQPVAVVMQENANDGKPSQRIAFRLCQEFLFHFFFFASRS